MANVNNPFGFRPVARAGGNPFSVTQFAKPASDGTAIYVNDIVMKAAVSLADPAGTPVTIPGITSGANGTPGTTLWLGPSLNYGAASTGTVHTVADENDLIMIAQVDATTSITSATHAGLNGNILLTAGSATTKQSAHTINHSTLATTSTLDFRIIAVSTQQPNLEGVYAIVEVVCNKHQYGFGTVGI